MRKRVLVTGGAGYVGSVLIPKLIDKNYNVRIIDLMLFGCNGLEKLDNLEIIKEDIRKEDVLEKVLEDVDYVIHLAAISNDPCSDLDPKLTEEVNYDATKKLVDISKRKGVKRFIYASSSSVYGVKEEENVTEDLSLEPLTIYSKTKMWSEEYVLNANDSDNFITVVIRPATVCGYSPRMRLDLTVNILTDHALNKGKITVFGGDQKRPNIHIQDITDYYVELLTSKKEKIAGEIFNAGYENYKVMEIAEMVKEIIGKHVVIERTDSKDNRSYHISSDKIRDKLGLTPNYTLKDAIKEIKKAFELGLIVNPSISVYKNIERMKEIGADKLINGN